MAAAAAPRRDRHWAHAVLPATSPPPLTEPCALPEDATKLAAFLGACKAAFLANADGPTSSDGTKWALLHDAEGVRILSASTAVANNRFRLEATFPFPPPLVRQRILDARLAWDTNLATLEWSSAVDLAALHAGVGLLLITTHPVAVIAARDFVDVTHTEVDPSTGVLTGYGASVTHASAPPVPGTVRGGNYPGCGWRMAPHWPAGAPEGADPDTAPSTALVYVIHSNLRGWLPTMAINAGMKGNFLDFVASLSADLAAASSATTAPAS